MKSVLLLFVSMFAFNAFAARQTITCVEKTKSKFKDEIVATFNPEVELNEMWRKGKFGDEIIGYTIGKEDSGAFTTARVSLTVAANSSFAGVYKLAGYYEVNQQKGTGGYASTFGGKPYRIIHGYDKIHSMDIMIYYPEEIVGQNATKFPGKLAYQPSVVDQGYYQPDMVCDSVVK